MDELPQKDGKEKKKMERDRKFIKLMFATSVFLSSCVQNTTPSPVVYPEFITPQPDLIPLATPTIISPTPTPTPHVTETPQINITNGMTGAIYETVQNPEGKPGKCVRLGYYSQYNKQTVIGAAVALGPDPSTYRDHYNFKVFTPDYKTIGSFTTDEIPMDENFRIVPPGTIVCES